MVGDNRQIVRESQLFWQLSEAQLDSIMELCQEESYGAGEYVHTEGESAPNLYIVKEGKVALEMEVRIGARTTRQAVIDVMVRGEVFGWSAISARPVRTMSATCSEPTTVLVFDGRQIRQLFAEDLDLCCKVMDEVVNLVQDRLSQAKQTLAHVLSVTSHDLRAPLATVQSCMDTVLGGFTGSVNERQRELLEGGRTRIADLTKMIDNILDISYIEIREQDFAEVSLPDVVANSLGDVQGMAQRKSIAITADVSEDLPGILGVAGRLRQVLTNLLSNAVKFTNEGGNVSVSAREDGDLVRLDVCDTGIGITTEELPKIFDDFYRGQTPDAEGAGLGLPIAKRIIESHGGVIWAESPCGDSGVGTRFSFTLPRVPAANGRDEATDDKTPPTNARILVTDDDPEMRKVVSLVLGSQGYQVSTAADGEEALAMIEQEAPDLLILDLLMPRMDGFEVCRRLSERAKSGKPAFPILLLTAVREDTSRRRYELETEETLKVDGYMEKPISPPLLLQRTASMLTNAWLRDESQARP
jgi:signal transduction histidine kinase/CheY-like chemotaxis protein